jgi:hypothetical protein
MLVSRYERRPEGCLNLFVPRLANTSRRPNSVRSADRLPLIDSGRGSRLARATSSTPDRPPSVLVPRSISSSRSNFGIHRSPSGVHLPFIEPDLSTLPGIESGDFEMRFRVKLSQCHKRFDFTDANAESVGKANKVKELMRLLKAVEVPGDARRFSTTLVDAIVEMVRANVDRPLPLIDPQMVITDDIPPFADPEWEHLKLVYQIVIRFKESAPRCPQLDLGFMKMILKQIGSRDEREHAAIVQIVMQYAATARPEGLTELFAALAQELAGWENSPNYMFAVTVVLEITRSFLTEFPGSFKSAQLLIDRCLPFLTARGFLFFRTSFFGFLSALLGTDYPFSMRILTLVVRYWPYLASGKQALFIRIFSMTLPRVSARQMGPLTPKVLAILGDAVQSPSGHVAEAALALLTERSLESFVVGNIRTLIPALHGPLKATSANHWSSAVRDLAKKTSNTLSMLTPRACQELWHRDSPQMESAAWRLQSWTQIAQSASRDDNPTNEKMAEISRIFGAEVTAARSDNKLRRRGSFTSIPDPGLLLPPSALLWPVKEDDRF